MRLALKNIVYSQIESVKLVLDLDLPENAGTPFPVVVWIDSGGGLQRKNQSHPMAIINEGLLAVGFAVASIAYRPLSQTIFPAQIQECKTAVRWLRANSEQYHLNPDRLGVWGFSAGGYLAALLGATSHTDLFVSDEYFNYSSEVRAVCTYGAPAILSKRTTPTPELLASANLTSTLIPADLLNYFTSDCPPFLIIQGQTDSFTSPTQGKILQEVLTKLNVPTQLCIVPDSGHSMHGLPQAEKDYIVSIICNFFKQYLTK